MAIARAKAAKVVGRYQLTHELATSYLGPLWAARIEGGDPAELAMLRLISLSRLDADTRVRLLEAAWQAMEVRDDRVCPVTDVVASDGELGIISAYVEGLPLRALQGLASVRRKPMPIPIALRIVMDLVEGVAGLHRTMLELGEDAVPLFGGISADSVLVGTDGRTGILDVAVASVAATVESLGGNAERVAYDAPEQVSSPPRADARTDVFALGVLAWELLSSRRLFIGADKAVSQKVLAAKIPRLDEVKRKGDPEVPPSLLVVVTRALERDADARYQTARELGQALAETGVTAGTAEEVAEYVATVAEGALSRIRDTLKLPSASRAAPAGWGKPKPPEVVVQANATVSVGEPKASPGKPAVPVRAPAAVATATGPKPLSPAAAARPAQLAGSRPRQPTMLGIPLPSQAEAASRGLNLHAGKPEVAAPQKAGATSDLAQTVAPPPLSEAAQFLDDAVESIPSAAGAPSEQPSSEEQPGRYSFSDFAEQFERPAQPSSPSPGLVDEPATRPREPDHRVPTGAAEPSASTEVATFEAGAWLDDPISSQYPLAPESTPNAPVADGAPTPVPAAPVGMTRALREGVVPARADVRPPPRQLDSALGEAPVEPRRHSLPVRSIPPKADAGALPNAARPTEHPRFSRPPPAQPYIPSQIPPPLIHDPRANRLVSAAPPPPAPQFNRGVLLGVVGSLALVIVSAGLAMFAMRGHRDEGDMEPRAGAAAPAVAAQTVPATATAVPPPPPPEASAPAAPGTAAVPAAAPAENVAAAAAAPAVAAPAGARAAPRAARRSKKKSSKFVPDDI